MQVHHDNLKKTIVNPLTSKLPKILPFLAWAVMVNPLPLSTVILMNYFGTDMMPTISISMAYEKAKLDNLKRYGNPGSFSRNIILLTSLRLLLGSSSIPSS